jgi:hypothetical protein
VLIGCFGHEMARFSGHRVSRNLQLARHEAFYAKYTIFVEYTILITDERDSK